MKEKLLDIYDADEVHEYKLSITCMGDKEINDLEAHLDDIQSRLEIIEVWTAYGLEGSYSEPIKNKDI